MGKAKKKSKTKGRRRQKKTAPRKSVPMPSDDDLNHWLNFVLYAVVGRMNEADQLMRSYGPGIERTAKWMMQQRPVRLPPLWRGVLLEPGEVVGGHWMVHQPERTFISYSEDRDVACWFADPRSVISRFVAARRPGVRGYVSGGKIDRDKVLWHHQWREVPLPGLPPINLLRAGAMHPDIDPHQLAWNIQTQSEVIVSAPKRRETKFHVDPVSKIECGEIEELDARYTYPPFLHERYGV